VIDPGEACDDGASNGTAAGTCLRDCRASSCGDGVVDPGEGCDDGSKNNDSRAGACRTDCKLAHCGDGVVDPGETCDGSTGCSDPCARGRAARQAAIGSDGGDRAAADGGEPVTWHHADCSCRAVRGNRDGGPLLVGAPLAMVGAWRCRRRVLRSRAGP
jgi:hypothetical protein